MSKRSRKSAARRKKSQAAPAQAPEQEPIQERPKAGPGQVFTREFIDMKSGYAKRYRNIAHSGLTLAFYRGHLCSVRPHLATANGAILTAEDRYAAGQEFEKLWYIIHRTGMRDSTVEGISGFSGLFWTEAKEQASCRMAGVRERMERTNFAIACAFCGDGFSMTDSLAAAGLETAREGIAARIRESLDDLVYASGRATQAGAGARNAMLARVIALSAELARAVA